MSWFKELINDLSRSFRKDVRDPTFEEVKAAAERLLPYSQERLVIFLTIKILPVFPRLIAKLIEEAEKLNLRFEWPGAPDRLKGQ